ncbi:MAG: hypothetical protein FK734_08515, partial [Asgard group archaeon]|nr:hypothetical protein [Asgard group archaeon]
KKLISLPKDQMTINSYIGSRVARIDHDTREILAREIHETYRTNQLNKQQNQKEPSLSDWDNLLEYLKDYNRKHADHIIEKLQLINCIITKVQGPTVKLFKFTDAQIELMAELEHANWNIERLLDGWKLGKEKDVTNKISPYIVPWSNLSEEMKEIDREMVRAIPEILAKANLEVKKLT